MASIVDQFDGFFSGDLSSEKSSSPIPSNPGNPSIINSATGFLSKAADTALDLFAVYEKFKPSKAVGTAYPTGQVDPSKVKSDKTAAVQTSANTGIPPVYIIAGLAGVVLIGGIIILTRGNK